MNKPKDGQGQFDGPNSIRHHSREVWPEMIRKGPGKLLNKLGLPGIPGIPGVIVGVGPELADMTNDKGPYDDRVSPPPSHSTIQMTMRYAHLGPEIVRDAVKLLDAGSAQVGGTSWQRNGRVTESPS